VIHHGDLFDILPRLPESSIDACVTDPPYGLGFMAKEWDVPGGIGAFPMRRRVETDAVNTGASRQGGRQRSGADFQKRQMRDAQKFEADAERWALEVFRVLKPGAHLVSFGGTRMFHRMTAGIEDAGFEVRDCLSWLYGQGFPKSLNLPNGLGTALKPSWEPIILARKPTDGTVAANVEKHGTAALNIDACRIGGEERTYDLTMVPGGFETTGGGRNVKSGEKTVTGRWPANVVLDEEAAALLDEQSGELTSGDPCGIKAGGQKNCFGVFAGGIPVTGFGDSGGASRFYYVAKPSREERDYGCWDLPSLSSFDTVLRDPSSAGANNPRAGAGRMAMLNTSEIVYNDPLWVNAVLARRLQAATDSSRPKVIGASTTQCSDGSAWSMCWCGSPSTDPFHPVVRSIIETETSSITPSRISNSSRRPHTNGCMAAAFGVMAAGGNLAAYAEFQSPWARLIGTSRKKDGRSTEDVNLATSIASWLTSAPEKPANVRRNGHPTVKPVELMRWLVRLVTPPGGTVLDPFTGSGTTGMACRYELREFIGIEKEADYVQIAERRIAAVAPLFASEAV
jgi:DNA modification methylase